MKKNTTILGIICLLTFSGNLIAQEHSIESVGRSSLKNFGEIFNNDVIKGYYFFYQSEKASKDKMGYEIVVLNENLSEIGKGRITDNKKVVLLEAAYNGAYLLFKFYDLKSKTISYRTMDAMGKVSEKINVNRKLTAYEIQTYTMGIQNNTESNTLYTPDNQGFIDIHPYKDKFYSYECNYIDNSGKTLWTYLPTHGKDAKVKGANYLTSDDNQILLVEANSKGAMSRDITFSIVALNKMGKESFTLPLNTNMYNLMPHNAIPDKKSDTFLIIGEYYDISDKSGKAESKGIFTKTINDEGMSVNENYVSWEKDIRKMAKGKDQENLLKYSVYFHEVIQTQDGTILAIGEQYRKQFSASGAALKVVAGNNTNAGLAEMKVGDLVVLKLGSNAKLEDVALFSKKPNRILLPSGYEFVSGHLLGKYMKSMGYYDYAFRQFNGNKSVATIAYYDLEKEKGTWGKTLYFHFVTHVDGEEGFSKDKVSLENKATEMRIFKSKPGYVLVAEYHKKAKQVKIRLQPLNY